MPAEQPAEMRELIEDLNEIIRTTNNDVARATTDYAEKRALRHGLVELERRIAMSTR